MTLFSKQKVSFVSLVALLLSAFFFASCSSGDDGGSSFIPVPVGVASGAAFTESCNIAFPFALDTNEVKAGQDITSWMVPKFDGAARAAESEAVIESLTVKIKVVISETIISVEISGKAPDKTGTMSVSVQVPKDMTKDKKEVSVVSNVWSKSVVSTQPAVPSGSSGPGSTSGTSAGTATATSYTLVAYGDETQITAAQWATYKTVLKEGEDYTISGTKINVTYSGLIKIKNLLSSGQGGGGTAVPSGQSDGMATLIVSLNGIAMEPTRQSVTLSTLKEMSATQGLYTDAACTKKAVTFTAGGTYYMNGGGSGGTSTGIPTGTQTGTTPGTSSSGGYGPGDYTYSYGTYSVKYTLKKDGTFTASNGMYGKYTIDGNHIILSQTGTTNKYMLEILGPGKVSQGIAC